MLMHSGGLHNATSQFGHQLIQGQAHTQALRAEHTNTLVGIRHVQDKMIHSGYASSFVVSYRGCQRTMKSAF